MDGSEQVDKKERSLLLHFGIPQRSPPSLLSSHSIDCHHIDWEGKASRRNHFHLIDLLLPASGHYIIFLIHPFSPSQQADDQTTTPPQTAFCPPYRKPSPRPAHGHRTRALDKPILHSSLLRATRRKSQWRLFRSSSRRSCSSQVLGSNRPQSASTPAYAELNPPHHEAWSLPCFWHWLTFSFCIFTDIRIRPVHLHSRKEE